jgi:hypothetical protein
MFYELNKLDPLGRKPWKRDDVTGLVGGSYEASLNELAVLSLLLDPKASLPDMVDPVASSIKISTDANAIDAELGVGPNIWTLLGKLFPDVPNLLPDGSVESDSAVVQNPANFMYD